jgi:hypothetical protein
VRSTKVGQKPSYTCRSGKHVVRVADAVDQLVTKVIIERLSRPDVLDLIVRDTGHDTAPLHARAGALRERLNGLARAYADGGIDARQLWEGSEHARAQLAEVEDQIAVLSRGSTLTGVADAADPGRVWATLDLDRRRAIIDTLLEVTILPARKGRRSGWRPGEPYFDPSTVRMDPKRETL